MEDLVIGNIEVIAFVIGTIQVVKQFIEANGKPMSTRATMLVSLIVGILYIVPTMLVLDGIVNSGAERVVVLVLHIVGYLLGILGGYGLVDKKVLQPLTGRQH